MRFVLGLTLFFGFLSTPAHAALDEVLTSGEGVRTVRMGDHDLKVRERGNIKELADAEGKVAAVAWQGFFDLHELLGTHYAEYERALRSGRRGLHLVHVVTDGMEVSIVSYGAMRQGSVTLMKRLPEGVKIDAIR